VSTVTGSFSDETCSDDITGQPPLKARYIGDPGGHKNPLARRPAPGRMAGRGGHLSYRCLLK
jgi:hypothetical protein